MKIPQPIFLPPSRSLLSCALACCLVMAAPDAVFAQSTAATVRGQVIVDAAPAAGASVTATNLSTGLTRKVQTTQNGGYNLAGLPPGPYRIDVSASGRSSSQTVTLQVGQTVTMTLGADGAPATDATTLQTVRVTAPVVVETKTSEVASYVTQRQIESLPQGTRNFLAFADTVPGVAFSRDDAGNARLRSGAQGVNGINVFIDGVSQKSYTVPGGIAGQDSSRGNPFPQSAIGEYKVITSNYKAEFDQISSAAIVAATRSGSNAFSGNFFYDKTNTQWREPTPAEEKAGKKVKSKEEQYGLSLSGPLIQDKLHYFFAYEAKEYSTPKTIELGSPSRFPPSLVSPEMAAQLGTSASPFKQDMYFGKLTWSLNDANYLEFSAQIRRENEILRNGGQEGASYATVKSNDVTRYDLRHQFNGDRWLNDAHITYEDTSWAPRPLTQGYGKIITVAELTSTERRNEALVLKYGATPDNQDKGQKGWGVQDDLTFTGWDGHTIKMGAKYKSIDVNAIERLFSNPQFYYDITNLNQPYRVDFGSGVPGTLQGFTTSSNRQFGLYIQDDWEVNDKLLLNLGVRWDYETTPTYEDYVTPAALAANVRAWPNIHQPGVDYDIENYISNGNNRRPDKNNIAPRLGFSYDLNADQRHVIFGGAGRAYDRNVFDYLQIESGRTSYGRFTFNFPDADGVCRAGQCVPWNPAYLQRGMLGQLAQTVNLPREWYFNNNQLKVPYSDQFSLGMRNLFGMLGQEWLSEVTLAHIRSKDGIVARLGNRRADGSYFPPGHTWGPPWADPPFGRIILIDNMYETRANSLLAKLEKPYTRASRWGLTLAYTFTDGEQNTNADGDIGMYDYPNPSYYGWLPARGVARHRFVGSGMVDGPWGMLLSAKLTLESPKPRNGINCLAGWEDCIIDHYTPGGTFGFKQLDLALTKELALEENLKLRFRIDALNVTNARNWNSFDDWWGAPGEPNANLSAHYDAIAYPTRMFKLSFGVNW